jgi:hypothetical protein
MFYLAAGDPFAALAGTLAKDFMRIPRHGKSVVGGNYTFVIESNLDLMICSAAANFILSALGTTYVIHFYLTHLGSEAHCCNFGSDLNSKSITLGLIGGFASTISELAVNTPRCVFPKLVLSFLTLFL